MWKRLGKYIKKKKTHGFTIMVVPNTEGNVRSICIPFFVVLIMLAFVTFNIAFICYFPAQIWQTVKKDALIRVQKRDLKRVEPSIRKTEQIVDRMQEQEQLEASVRNYLRIVQNKVGHHGSVSRGARPSILIPPSRFNRGYGEETQLGLLNHNLEYIEKTNPVVKGDLKQLLEDLTAFSTEYDHIPTIWPAYGRITSGFGVRRHPITHRYTSHTGVDINVRIGTAVRSAADGVVEFAGYRGGYGWAVIVNHGYGYKTLYAHNSRLMVQVGQTISKGQLISYSGSSGSSTGPHLHYEVIVGNNQVNPISFLGR